MLFSITWICTCLKECPTILRTIKGEIQRVVHVLMFNTHVWSSSDQFVKSMLLNAIVDRYSAYNGCWGIPVGSSCIQTPDRLWTRISYICSRNVPNTCSRCYLCAPNVLHDNHCIPTWYVHTVDNDNNIRLVSHLVSVAFRCCRIRMRESSLQTSNRLLPRPGPMPRIRPKSLSNMPTTKTSFTGVWLPKCLANC